jgi:hypothetical protein
VSASTAADAHLIDVDLHVESRRSLADLHAALPNAQPHGVERPKWVHVAAFTSRRAKTVDQKVMELVALVDALPRAAKRCWREARVRTFDIGIQAGPARPESAGSRPLELTLAPETMRAAVRLKASVTVTVYPPTSS